MMSPKSSVQSAVFRQVWGPSCLFDIYSNLSLSPSCRRLSADRVLASGSVQLPRFTLLESGSLLISPSHLSDAGTYTCMASNSRGIDEASADLVVWGRSTIARFLYKA